MNIRRKLINVKAAPQPNRVLIHKPARIRLVIPIKVIVQPRLRIKILVLQPERLVRAGNIRLAVESAPAVVITEPQQPAVLIGHLARDADLVAVEVVGLLVAFSVFVDPVTYLRQRFVAVGIGVDIGISAVRLDFLKEVATDPNESGYLFEVL